MYSQKSSCGRNLKKTVQLSLLPTIPLNQRGTLHDTAAEIGVPKTNLQIMLKGEKLMAHESTANPTTSMAKMQRRINCCVNCINTNHQMFEEIVDVVHLDENWFYLNLKSTVTTWEVSRGEHTEPQRVSSLRLR